MKAVDFCVSFLFSQAISLAAESKREEEKAKGLAPENGSENPDIVPFEDNEEEEEEESEEEDESFGQGFNTAAQGRGRGRGGMMMWPPQAPFPRGPRPLPGMRALSPGMMGSDGFSYGGPHMPDLFNMGPRGFPPYGPRFPGDFAGPGPNMMFHGRPSLPGNFPGGGFGMMGAPGRAPFMGGMGGGGRPVGGPPFFPPPQSQPSNRPKRDPKGLGNEITSSGSGPHDEGQYQQRAKGQQEERFSARSSSIRNDGSESEDEAPRRSRHGEGKKQKRGEEADDANDDDQRL